MTEEQKAKLAELRQDANAKHLEYVAAQRAVDTFLRSLSAAQIGDIVRVRLTGSRDKGKDYRVTRVGPGWSNPEHPWLYGVVRLKSGEWGKAERCLHSDWEKVA